MVRNLRWGGLAVWTLLAVSCNELARKPEQKSAAAGVTISEPLSQSYSSPNGLITVHYPADFAAKIVGKSGIMLTRNLPDGNAELLTFVSVAAPVTTDLNELSRVINVAEIKELTGYSEQSRANKPCNGAPGIEIISSWKPADGSPEFRRSCVFQRNGHGYSFAYMLPSELQTTNRPLLEAIVEATTFGP